MKKPVGLKQSPNTLSTMLAYHCYSFFQVNRFTPSLKFKCSVSDDVIEPPAKKDKPFHVDHFPQTAGYRMKIVDGVYQVLREEDHPMPWLPFDRDQFLIDYDHLFALMTNSHL